MKKIIDDLYIVILFGLSVLIIVNAIDERTDPCHAIKMVKKNIKFNRFDGTVIYQCEAEDE